MERRGKTKAGGSFRYHHWGYIALLMQGYLLSRTHAGSRAGRWLVIGVMGLMIGVTANAWLQSLI